MQELQSKTKPKSKISKNIIYIIFVVIFLSTGIYYNQNIILELANFFKEKGNIRELSYLNDDSKNILKLEADKQSTVAVGEHLFDENDIRVQHRKFDNKLNDYRNYLFNINLLIANFFQNKPYTSQLNAIGPITQIMPLNIQNILSNLISYNTEFLVNAIPLQNEIIFPKNNLLIRRLITIEKKQKYCEDMENLRSQIVKDIDGFINFFYSDTFQQKFIEQIK